MDLTFNDFQMTQKTVESAIMQLTEAELSKTVMRKAQKTSRTGRKSIRYCLIVDGHKIRNAKEFKSFISANGLHSASIAKLHRLLS